MTFSEACSLKNHWRTNLGEKTFPCKECPKAFSQGGQLKIHFTKHSGEKPYRSVNVKVTFQTIKFLAFSDKLAHLQTKMEFLVICVVYLGFYIRHKSDQTYSKRTATLCFSEHQGFREQMKTT